MLRIYKSHFVLFILYYLLEFSVWTMKTKKLHLDLPGHGDEVFAVDWSPDSQRVVSGGRDKILKL